MQTERDPTQITQTLMPKWTIISVGLSIIWMLGKDLHRPTNLPFNGWPDWPENSPDRSMWDGCCVRACMCACACVWVLWIPNWMMKYIFNEFKQNECSRMILHSPCRSFCWLSNKEKHDRPPERIEYHPSHRPGQMFAMLKLPKTITNPTNRSTRIESNNPSKV